MNGPIDWAVNEMPSDFTIKIFIMAMLVTPCTVITTCLFQRLMWIMTTEMETLKKAAAPDFTRYLLFTYNVHTYYYLAHWNKQPISKPRILTVHSLSKAGLLYIKPALERL